MSGITYMNGKIERFWQNIQVDEVAWDQIQNLIENYNATPHTQLPKNPEIHTWFTPNKFYDISEKYDTTKEPLWKVDGEIKDLRISLQHFRERRANQRN
ncbi:hypothetical protein TVAGG3_0295000 [Trichomonas vaginalis G3]|uniref:hypothetical protein n=2 Tax=Trichomonas vaginalis (strain ATCC PRA-98 / G3) TaxID=412133 RepID=UPI0021E5E688|nr:hypothetical protein TVAGG3_0295000 [Trichomonas vaginalis G3]KAI5527541.1 hypothetical protein TVAGG3_0295000 [Trichomonas vaginalis G3]